MYKGMEVGDQTACVINNKKANLAGLRSVRQVMYNKFRKVGLS